VHGQRQAMFVSYAWCVEDVDRLEQRIALAHAHRAAALALQQAGANRTPALAADLTASRSWRTGRTAADSYAEFAESVSALA